MVSKKMQLWSSLAVVVVLTLIGCSSGPKEDPATAEFAAVEAAKVVLDGKRQELTTLLEQAAMPVEEPAEGEEAAEPVDYSGQIEALREEVETLSDSFGGQLVAFLNNNPILAEQGPTELQLAGIRLKSSEDMLLAQEWIDEGGDYKRAIQIHQAALQLDPDNEELKAAMARAEAMRFMSEERFATATKGMTQDAVREALGTPLHHNIRTYEDRGVTAWFYPSADDGAAAAVWFKPGDDGEMVTYQIKYEAVDGRGEEL